MGYSININAVTLSGHSYSVESNNITYNLSKMFCEAGCCLDDLSGRTTEDAVNKITDMLNKMEASPGYFQQFNAPNGWGVFEHAVRFLKELRQQCDEHPGCEISVS